MEEGTLTSKTVNGEVTIDSLVAEIKERLPKLKTNENDSLFSFFIDKQSNVIFCALIARVSDEKLKTRCQHDIAISCLHDLCDNINEVCYQNNKVELVLLQNNAVTPPSEPSGGPVGP